MILRDPGFQVSVQPIPSSSELIQYAYLTLGVDTEWNENDFWSQFV